MMGDMDRPQEKDNTGTSRRGQKVGGNTGSSPVSSLLHLPQQLDLQEPALWVPISRSPKGFLALSL